MDGIKLVLLLVLGSVAQAMIGVLVIVVLCVIVTCWMLFKMFDRLKSYVCSVKRG